MLAMKRWLGPLLLVSVVGCFSTPTPLAPGIGGSVGVPHRGTLSGGASLPQKGPGFRRLRDDGVRWGNPRLVAALERAAGSVREQRGGEVSLIIADLSAHHGGKVVRHRSHRSGRDVDLLFYALTPDGRPVDNPGFLHFGPDGLAAAPKPEGGFLRLDLDRNWLLIKALVSDERASVQWLFVARWVEALIMEHALALGEDDAVLLRAAKVMWQPSDSASHDDHIHLRIACSPEEEVAGCQGGPPRWRWLPRPPEDPPQRDAELLSALLDDSSEQRP